MPNHFDPDAVCDKSVYDVLDPQQFEDCITTCQPTTQVTTQVVSVQKNHKERHDQGKVPSQDVNRQKQVEG